MIMYELYPYFTNDGSVGLYSPEADDIYHSTYGALSEAYEKFIIPAELDKYFKTNSEIKVLDICYGIGYNTKSFLNFILENFENNLEKKSKKLSNVNQYNVPIYTNNISNNTNIETIDTDNNFNKKTVHGHKKLKIFIKAIDTDKNLLYLSPFFKTGKKSDLKKSFKSFAATLPNTNETEFHKEKISKFLKKEFIQKYILKREINGILLDKIIEKHPEILEDIEINRILKDKKYAAFFDPFMKGLINFYKNQTSLNTHLKPLGAFLHNIYYRYLSIRYKKALKCLKSLDLSFETKINDARAEMQDDSNTYNFVFLDAFTPAKCPALWTVDFFKLLFNSLDENGIILTYSNSTAIRNSFLNAGFYVGKIHNKEIGKYTGTIAAKNKSMIKHELSEYDLGLLKTRAGIFYHDKELNASNETIIENHKKEYENSKLETSSKYIKEFRRNNEI